MRRPKYLREEPFTPWEQIVAVTIYMVVPAFVAMLIVWGIIWMSGM